MRNPWASEGYTGPYSDKSEGNEMTAAVAEELGHIIDKGDGEFYMTIKDFVSQTNYVGIN
jgi:hypothetical protein